MSELKLRTATRTQGDNEALKTGDVRPDGFRFDFVEVPVLVQGFRRMVRTLEFDVCEMALTTYQYNVDLSRITWVLSGDEHVEASRPPDNVVPIEPGSSLEELLRRGDLAAVIGADIDAPDVVPLIPDSAEAGL
ncbi:hypothetical protein GCU67_13525 [Modestobacter muralis]|uniref:Uncharacterized protein n=1 Tax=Modestobacter muralis TaxID=1608614 RepID=A0A6P0EU21_9ACTN|nr:hypothetical protein [Modestobacter muralis]NEK95182.1 hypothetical protein [Modestobacter muralis]NEN52070.1 hypothetical protein [Modestobacter muralis]